MEQTPTLGSDDVGLADLNGLVLVLEDTLLRSGRGGTFSSHR